MDNVPPGMYDADFLNDLEADYHAFSQPHTPHRMQGNAASAPLATAAPVEENSAAAGHATTQHRDYLYPGESEPSNSSIPQSHVEQSQQISASVQHPERNAVNPLHVASNVSQPQHISTNSQGVIATNQVNGVQHNFQRTNQPLPEPKDASYGTPQPAAGTLPQRTADVVDLLSPERPSSDGVVARQEFKMNHHHKRQRTEGNSQSLSPHPASTPAAASNAARASQMPAWMKDEAQREQMRRHQSAHKITPGVSRPDYQAALNASRAEMQRKRQPAPIAPQYPAVIQHDPVFVEMLPGFVSTWEKPLPSQAIHRSLGRRKYELSLLNVREFTITGLPVHYDGPPSSLAGLRKKIKELSKDHGKASYERNQDGGDGRWKIPLGAYSAFFGYLVSDPNCEVIGIPMNQLKIASLGKARLEKGYPSASKLISQGVPRGLATSLAPFQRGGVDFVIERRGRALLADEMGLGKTVQGIASMSVYHQDWPILVLTPSSARYHWENEFQQWLGRNSSINKDHGKKKPFISSNDEENETEKYFEVDESRCMKLLADDQIHVLVNGKDKLLPGPRTKVVICSFGLAQSQAASGRLYPGLFRAAIVDESHMLKNMNTKRTKQLLPVLHATNRVVLLSGTPAFAKPNELWPQLKILSTEANDWCGNEGSFQSKYVKNTSAVRRAELHAMLTGTVMIRRMKNDILKSLPKKIRNKAIVDVSTPSLRIEFHSCMAQLREGRGQLGKLARQYTAVQPIGSATIQNPEPDRAEVDLARANELAAHDRKLRAEVDARFEAGVRELSYALMTSQSSLDIREREEWKAQRLAILNRELQVWHQEEMNAFRQGQIAIPDPEKERKNVLNRMYSLTGKAKLPLVCDMVRRFLDDRTQGKLCIFAHHIFMLDEIVKGAGLSNEDGSATKYIRIDGSTHPKERQNQIKTFQTDPSVRIAVLGITAAGVAVTLTAAATVWFTELFWTPALMIQAEDRCHRIGQNSRVNCLYFVATGTLDEILWKLLEKKFRDLGEFVEGKEKLKMVVDNTYHGTKELHSIFAAVDDDDDDDELELQSSGDEDDDLSELEHDLEKDIELLGREELTMLKTENEEDDEDRLDPLGQGKAEAVAGSTEDDAILLSDDENDTATGNHPNEVQAVSVKKQEAASSTPEVDTFDFRKPLQRCRGYSITFEGESFGIQMFIYLGRVIIGGKFNLEHQRPAVGDVLIAVNGQNLPQVTDINPISKFLKQSLERAAVELTFIEVPSLQRLVHDKIESDRKKQEALQAKMAKKISNGPGDVIDLLEDD